MATKVLVIGGGAAGLMAAGRAAEGGASVVLLEKNNHLGRKLLITGKGRCNLTNATDLDGLIANIPGNGRFLYSAFSAFSNEDLIGFFQQRGLEVKVERGKRVFPQSDQASDVVQVLQRYLQDNQVTVKYGKSVNELLTGPKGIRGARTTEGEEFAAPRVILATGGASYPGTGSTGDGYRLAQVLGHRIIPLRPSLVPLETREEWVPELQGLTLKNVAIRLVAEDNRQLGEEFGELLFTHFGVSGPTVLTLSRSLVEYLHSGGKAARLMINLKPALSTEQLDERLQRDFLAYQRKQFKNALGDLFPRKLIPIMIRLSGIDEAAFVHQITREERWRFCELITGLPLTISQARSLAEAVVTAGGVSTREINPKTMESKLVPGLFLAGEVIDIDGYTGGFNLQAAFSTGYAAGKAAAEGS